MLVVAVVVAGQQLACVVDQFVADQSERPQRLWEPGVAEGQELIGDLGPSGVVHETECNGVGRPKIPTSDSAWPTQRRAQARFQQISLGNRKALGGKGFSRKGPDHDESAPKAHCAPDPEQVPTVGGVRGGIR
jgi:hypothetical protein